LPDTPTVTLRESARQALISSLDQNARNMKPRFSKDGTVAWVAMADDEDPLTDDEVQALRDDFDEAFPRGYFTDEVDAPAAPHKARGAAKACLGCGIAVPYGEGNRCKECRSAKNRAARGDRKYNARWDHFREFFLRHHPACYDCSEEERNNQPATGSLMAKHVHHLIKPGVRPDLEFMESNCMGLCARHHSIRTKRGE
jgi:hypothetical protein